jgi:hypothetical protein
VSRAARLLAVAVLAVVAFLAPAAAAYAYWSSTASMTVTVSTSAVPGAPTAPTGVTCTGTGSPLVLSWTAVSTATEYRVYRTTNLTTPLHTVTTTSSTFTEAQMGTSTASQTYDVVVRAWNESGESSSSATVSMNFKGNKAC